jgi:hypothetical protein
MQRLSKAEERTVKRVLRDTATVEKAQKVKLERLGSAEQALAKDIKTSVAKAKEEARTLSAKILAVGAVTQSGSASARTRFKRVQEGAAVKHGLSKGNGAAGARLVVKPQARRAVGRVIGAQGARARARLAQGNRLARRLTGASVLFDEQLKVLQDKTLTIQERIRQVKRLETILTRQETLWDQLKRLLGDRTFLLTVVLAAVGIIAFYQAPAIFSSAGVAAERAGAAASNVLLSSTVLAAVTGAAYITYKLVAVGLVGPVGLLV